MLQISKELFVKELKEHINFISKTHGVEQLKKSDEMYKYMDENINVLNQIPLDYRKKFLNVALAKTDEFITYLRYKPNTNKLMQLLIKVKRNYKELLQKL